MRINEEKDSIIYDMIEEDRKKVRKLSNFQDFLKNCHLEKGYLTQGEITDFFDIKNTHFISESGYPSVESHHEEKMNLVNQLLDENILTKKSSRTFFVHPEYIEKCGITKDVEDTHDALKLIYFYGNIPGHNTDNKPTFFRNEYMANDIFRTCVCSRKGWINWHINRFHPTATVDRLREIGWASFFEENKNNSY